MKKTITLAAATASLLKTIESKRSYRTNSESIDSPELKTFQKALQQETSELEENIRLALKELDLDQDFFEKVKMISIQKRFWNYFQILDLLKFNLSDKRDGLRYIKVSPSTEEIILNNLSIEEFGLGHVDADTIYWCAIDTHGREIEFGSTDGIYNKVVETVDGKEQVYLFPKTKLEKILAI